MASVAAFLISNKYPFPADGKKVILSGLLGYLEQRFGADRVVYIVIGRPRAPQHEGGMSTIWLDPPGRGDEAVGCGRSQMAGPRSTPFSQHL